MPDFWQFPTVSMGLGPIMAIYQARFMKYLHNRGLLDTSQRKVWAFMGDGEMDEPEALGAITLASREKLDNLIFVVNCNPPAARRAGAGQRKRSSRSWRRRSAASRWNVIKVIWGSYWDPLLQLDTKGLLRKRMEEAVGRRSTRTSRRRAGRTRGEHFFGKYPELKKMVSNLSDEDIWRLNRGGHDPHKVYAAYAEAVKHTGEPTVILAKTVKGYGMGEAGEGQNVTHQQKKMGEDALKAFRDRFDIPISDDETRGRPLLPPPRGQSGDPLHARAPRASRRIPAAPPAQGRPQRNPRVVRIRRPAQGQRRARDVHHDGVRAHPHRAHPRPERRPLHRAIVPDEARTFGMEGLFRQLGIYSDKGQLYVPQDADQLMFYREARDGQILEEGITEAGAVSSWIAAATAYSNHGVNMIPFYIFYSMFGFQRIGDLAWAAGDMQARGFLVGGTAGRTTLAGEGLQHDDGHSHVLSSTIPNCASYDPTFAYELAVIVHDGLKRMFSEQESRFYYLTVMNENYPHPALPAGCEGRHPQGVVPVAGGAAAGPRRIPASWERGRPARNGPKVRGRRSAGPGERGCLARRRGPAA